MQSSNYLISIMLYARLLFPWRYTFHNNGKESEEGGVLTSTRRTYVQYVDSICGGARFSKAGSNNPAVDKQVVTSYVPGLTLDPLALPVTNPPFGKRSLRRGYLPHLVQDLTAICHFFLRLCGLTLNVRLSANIVCTRHIIRSDASFVHLYGT